MAAPDPQLRRPVRGPRHGFSAVLPALIGVNVAVFVFQLVAHHGAGLTGLERAFGLSADGLRAGHFWQLFTYMFLHSAENPMHIIANMLMLYFAGREVEMIAGPRHLLGIYFLGGLLGGVAQVLLGPGDGYLIGASAGVFAVLFAFTTTAPEMELTMLVFFVLPVRTKAKVLAGSLAFLSLVCAAAVFWGYLSPGGFLGSWGHLAHLGGALAGWFYIKQMGFGNPLRIQRYFLDKRQRDERLQRMPPAQFISQEIDPILDKISREGIHSLTRGERRILEKGRDKISRRSSAPRAG